MKKMKFLFVPTILPVSPVLCIMLCAHLYYVVVLSLRVYTKDK
jgi:hypothetical protein